MTGATEKESLENARDWENPDILIRFEQRIRVGKEIALMGDRKGLSQCTGLKTTAETG
jgi:hypothetical protein